MLKIETTLLSRLCLFGFSQLIYIINYPILNLKSATSTCLTMNNPIKHHFIPQFLLNRFCDANKKLHSFNKTTGKVNIKKYSPAAVCYEENLHTLIVRTEKSYDIEKFYSSIEGEFSTALKLVDAHIAEHGSLDKFPKTDELQNIIALFLSMSFWRIPTRNAIAQRARKNLRSLYDDSTDVSKDMLGYDRKFIRELERKSKGISGKICQFLVLPALLGSAKNDALNNCWFYS